MDSITQMALGASVAAVSLPAKHKRTGLWVGAALGTLPDLDVLIDFGNAVADFTYHRGFSHSLLVLTPFALCLSWVLQRFWSPVRESPRRWYLAITLALVTHPILDAHTTYGTQLLWPIDIPPAMWSTIFIIDPLYTLPLCFGVIYLACKPQSRRAMQCLCAGLLISQCYLAWSWLAKYRVHQKVELAIASGAISGDHIMVSPAPFNTLLWRILVRDQDRYGEGFESLLIDEHAIELDYHPLGAQYMEQTEGIWAVKRLQWFAHGWNKASVHNGHLVITDLRMGLDPNYVFRHEVAQVGNPHWQPVKPELLPADYSVDGLNFIWHRMFDAEAKRR